MGKPDIKSWLASTENMDSSDRDDDRTTALLDKARDDWPSFIETARAQLLSGKTKERVYFMENVMAYTARHSDMPPSNALQLCLLLSLTYPRYIDKESREAAQNLLVLFADKDDEMLGHIISWLRHEIGMLCERSTSVSSAPASKYTLLTWCSALYSHNITSRTTLRDQKNWNALLTSMALLLNSLLFPDEHIKSSIRRTSIALTRRAFRTSPQDIGFIIESLIAATKQASNKEPFLVLLGLACDVAFHLKNAASKYRELPPQIRKEIFQLYCDNVILSKSAVPAHIIDAFDGFIENCLTPEDLEYLLPVAEKAALRSPEFAFPVLIALVRAFVHPMKDEIQRRLVTMALTNAKANNPKTREYAVIFAQDLLKHISEKSVEEYFCTEIINTVKSGKSTGPEHRIALYSILNAFPPSREISGLVAEALETLLIKEAHEAALFRLANSVIPHIFFIVSTDTPTPPNLMKAIIKDINNASRPSVRHATSLIIGNVLEKCKEQGVQSQQFMEVAGSAEKAFETSLDNLTGQSASPIEGYIAISTLLGPIYEARKSDDLVDRVTASQVIIETIAKPSFLLSSKIYEKLTTEEDSIWFLRALQTASRALKGALGKTPHLRQQVGLAYIHFSTTSGHATIRRVAIKTLEEENKRNPVLLNSIIRESVEVYIGKHSSANKGRLIESDNSLSRSLGPVLATCATFADDESTELKFSLLAKLVILGHHPAVCGTAKGYWVELCQRAKVDPRVLIEAKQEQLIDEVLNHPDNKTRDGSVATLSFVAPEKIIPILISKITTDLKPSLFAELTDKAIGIWNTPEDTLFVDVLASKKDGPVVQKGKNAEIEKWEAELRASLSSKKAVANGAAPKTMTKQEKELVAQQLRLESQTRKKVDALYINATRSLDILKTLVALRMEAFGNYFDEIVQLLLNGVIKFGAPLLGERVQESYIALGEYCDGRLESYRKWIGVGTLRCRNASIVPEELKAEALSSLILRILYKLRPLSEQQPFDGPTFSYISPLLRSIIGASELIGSTEEDEPLERIALSISITNYHTSEFADLRYPRAQTLQDMLDIIRLYPSLGKDASSVVIALGEAIRGNVARSEINVLTKSLVTGEAYVRNAALQCLQALDITDLDWIPELWIACCDNDQQNGRLARHVWEDNGLDVPENFFTDLKPFLVHEQACIRLSCATSLTEAAIQWPQQLSGVISSLQEFYREKVKRLGPEFDEYGILITLSEEASNPWPARVAISQSFEALASLFVDDQIVPFFKFLIDEEVLGDSNSEVRAGMLAAAAKIIDIHGNKNLQSLIDMFETYLSTSTSPTEAADYVKEAVVILLGRVAGHLDKADSRVPGVVRRLTTALKTPSEQVQVAVSDCLAPLAKLAIPVMPTLVKDLLQELFNAPKYGERRGAAYGLAGIMKGIGIAGLQKYDIVERIRISLEDKKKYETRQGAMFLLETLSATLGRIFEPYIIELLPSLLNSFGDASSDVREAAEDAAKVIMANLSGYGVKKILPTLLDTLEERQWRTKKGSIELLGTMAYCSPKQLSISLPTIIPRLTAVLTDSHAQVRSSANKSLKQFGEVITNPEIQSLVPALLKALVDPAKTSAALSAVLKKSFAHYIDMPSLALVVPIIERGLKERGSDVKRKAAQIVGNLASLTDSQDFISYLDKLLPLVNTVLVDPVPEARATAAKALGTLVERLGEEQFPDMVPSLLRTLKTDSSGVDRLGAAQGLSEVLAGLGIERMEALLPDIVSNAQSPRSTVREGFMSLLVYLPATFGTRFQPHLTRIVGPILSGLSDHEEPVREAAMKAGRMIINNYSSKAIDLLLPELERGMFDSSWRIRQSSITLVGELLFKITGISGKAEIEEEEEEGGGVAVADSSRKALETNLGKERRDRVLTALYIVRQDGVAAVRQSSIHIWKALVSNTPRTVRELLPEIMSQVVNLLVDDDSDESPETASRTIGEICRKFGERVLGEMVSILRGKSGSSDYRTREGVCLALVDIMENATDHQRGGHEEDIVAIVRSSLVDDEENVRAAAARAFDSLQEHLGAKAIDQTIPTLLEALRQPGESSGTALQALKEVMNVRANSVFPVLIPTLTASPMTVFNAHALASLVTVAGSALSRRLSQVLGSLVNFMEQDNEEELAQAIDEAVRALLGSLSDAEGLNNLMMILLDWIQTGNPSRRASSCKLFGIFCEESDLDDSLYRVDWIRQLIRLLDESQVIVHTSAWKALDLFVKSVPKDELEPLVVTLRRSVESAGAPGRTVPGLNLPKGVSPLVPIIIAGLTTGSNEQRENAAYAIGDLITRTNEDAIKPFVVPFTGPLIRVAAQSTTYPPGVKVAILSALTAMLLHIPAYVKPFFPQLQRTFVKATSDPSSLAVRSKAGTALGVLMKSQPRVDPVITELIAGARASDDTIGSSYISSLAHVVKSAGDNVGQKAREACLELVEDAFKESHDEYYVQSVAALFASLSQFPGLLKSIVQQYLSAGTLPSPLSSHSILAVLSSDEEDEASTGPNLFQQLDVVASISRKVQDSIGSDKPSISRPAREAKERLSRLQSN